MGSQFYHIAQYSPWVQAHWNWLGFDSEPPPLIKGIQTTSMTAHLSRYFIPVSANGLETNGVIFLDAEDHLQDRRWFCIKMEIKFSPEKRDLAMALLDVFINRERLNQK